jgi:hypothetical protein
MWRWLQNNVKKPSHRFEFIFPLGTRNFLGLGTSWKLAICFVGKVLIVDEFPFYKILLQLFI